MTLKQVKWLGDSRERIRDFPDLPRHEAGYQLERVQAGKEPKDWKPMPSVGIGVNEIRVRDDSGAFRVIYVAKFAEAVYVLDALQKKSRKTRKSDLDLARKRFRDLIQERKRR
jgi:phage-related protein